MPRTYCWRRFVLAAALAVAATPGVMTASVRADDLVACFAAGNLEYHQTARPSVALPVSVLSAVQEMNPWVAFAPSDSGQAAGVARHRVKAKRALARGQALRKQLTLSALILMIFNVPTMPTQETTDTTAVATGLSGQGLVQTPSEVISSSSSPPTASEPAALFLGLWGGGLIGVYVGYRHTGRSRGRDGAPGRYRSHG